MDFLNKLFVGAVALAEDAGAAADAAGAAGATDQATGAGGSILIMLFQLFPLIIVFVLMYFLMLRPEKKRRKKEQEMLNALKRNDHVCTIGGIYGTIMDIKDDTITLAVGKDNASMVVARWAIRSVEDVSIENESEALN